MLLLIRFRSFYPENNYHRDNLKSLNASVISFPSESNIAKTAGGQSLIKLSLSFRNRSDDAMYLLIKALMNEGYFRWLVRFYVNFSNEQRRVR